MIISQFKVYIHVFIIIILKDTVRVLRGDEPLAHVSIDISLITKHIES